MLQDAYGRPITYLRVSITDRCNLRCVYCMPEEGVPWQAHENILRFEEIVAVVRVMAEQGIRSVRLTGGEPLVRKGVVDLVQMIADVPGIEDVSLTTNGILLEKYAADLAKAALKRVNVSLDTLQAEKFSRITRGGCIETVWRGIQAAESCGLQPVKINVVVMRSVNDEELLDIARLTQTHPWHIRFIELMPVNNRYFWGPGYPMPDDAYFSIGEMLSVLQPLGLQRIPKSVGSGPAREYCIPGSPGKIGFISPLGEHFCENCNRLRLTADGYLRPCLLSDTEVAVREVLRTGGDILPYIQQAIALKPEGHELALEHLPNRRCMRDIGG